MRTKYPSAESAPYRISSRQSSAPQSRSPPYKIRQSRVRAALTTFVLGPLVLNIIDSAIPPLGESLTRGKTCRFSSHDLAAPHSAITRVKMAGNEPIPAETHSEGR